MLQSFPTVAIHKTESYINFVCAKLVPREKLSGGENGLGAIY